MTIKKHIRGMYGGMVGILTNFIIPYLPSRHLRYILLKLLGVKLSRNVKMFQGFKIRNPKGLTMEDGVSIGPGALLDARKGLHVKKSAVIAYDAIIWTLNHDYNDTNFCGKGAPVTIGAYSWICCRSIILPGITVGDYAVVASGAIVTKNVPPYAIVAGVPAKIIGYREKKCYDYGYNVKNDYSHFI